MIGTELAKKLNKKVGDDIDLFGNKFHVIGIYESPNSKESNSLIISLMDLQSLTGQFREVGGFAVAAERPMDEEGFEKLRHRIEAVQPGLEVTRVRRSNTDAEAKSKADGKDGN
jgi:putative ABC transport system permease protein